MGNDEKARQWYEELFLNYAERYEKECFAAGTDGECCFIEKEIEFDRSIKILDIGCGTGRHSVEMAKRGYKVTGVDLSESMLKKARIKAAAAGVNVEFARRDARKLDFDAGFGLVIMMCEGAFPLMETDEMNYEILKGASRALKQGGKFIFTTLNGLFPIFNSVEKFCSAASQGQGAAYRDNTFDLMTFRDHNTTEFTDDSGNKKSLRCSERYYVPPEITWLLKSIGFVKVEIFGAKLGAFSRADALTKDDFEMLVIAEKGEK